MHTALENMRYGACTAEDISFLETKIAGRHPNQPKLAAKIFQNPSIITKEESQNGLANIPLMPLALGCKISYGIFLMQQLPTFLEDSLLYWDACDDQKQ